MKTNQRLAKTEFHTKALSMRNGIHTLHQTLDNMLKRIQRIENTMATKEDVNKILNAIAAFTQRSESNFAEKTNVI